MSDQNTPLQALLKVWNELDLTKSTNRDTRITDAPVPVPRAWFGRMAKAIDACLGAGLPAAAPTQPLGYIHKDAAALHLKDPSGWARMQATADDTFTVPVFLASPAPAAAPALNAQPWPPGTSMLQVAVAPHAAAGPYPTAMRPATAEEAAQMQARFGEAAAPSVLPMALTDSRCNYVSAPGRVCSKCGRTHDGGGSPWPGIIGVEQEAASPTGVAAPQADPVHPAVNDAGKDSRQGSALSAREPSAGSDEAIKGYTYRGGVKTYCCYGMYCDVGHSNDCKHAQPDGKETA